MKKILFPVIALMFITGTVCIIAAQTEGTLFLEVVGTVKNGKRLVPFTALVPRGKGPFPLVVMNHGHGGSREENGGFKRLAEAISGRGIATIRMDFPGCGESKEPFTQNTMTAMISDSNECLAHMLKNYPIDKKRLGIFGYSMGGRIAMDIVKKSNQPYKAMGLLAPAVTRGQDLINLLAGGEEKAKALEAEAALKGFAVLAAYGQMLSKEWFKNLQNSEPLDKVTFKGPSIIVHGKKDAVISQDECNAAYRELKKAGSNVQQITLNDADHGYGFFREEPHITKAVESIFADFFAGNL